MTRYAVSPDAACATIADGAVVLNLRTKRYYSLNETAAAIWQLLEADAPLEDVVEQLVSRYRTNDEIASRSVEQLVGELTAEDLISAVAR